MCIADGKSGLSVDMRAVARGMMTCCLLVAAVALSPGCNSFTGDPANSAADPGEMRGDALDRRAACAVERARGIKIGCMLLDADRDVDVVSRLFESRGRAGDPEWGHPGIPYSATATLLVRRARATYVVAERAMRDPDSDARWWGLAALEIVEGRFRGPSPKHQGPAYRGPERHRALSAVGRLALADPDPDVRAGAISLAQERFPRALDWVDLERTR